MIDFVRKAKWSYICASAVIAILGLCCIIFPESVSGALGWIIGLGSLIIGVVRLIMYFTHEHEGLDIGFTIGIIFIAVGVIFLTCWNAILSIIAIVTGIIFIVDSILKVQFSLDSKRLGYKNWWISLVIAAVVAAGGIVLIAVPFGAVKTMFRVLGIVLLIDSIQNLYSVINATVVMDKINKNNNAIETECTKVE